ncbi:MAG: TIGR03960 family B12-binding radical SAM protein [Clostridiales bacterium]|nr:TIGR03960 family B12-binding radical SAM protein [Clostridiales bacterium]
MQKVEIDELLFKVEKPGQYLGNEINSSHKTVNENTIRYCACFPDVYEIGMSHLGTQILYNLINTVEDVYCERVFAPANDLEKLMREKQVPLFALESRNALRYFDFLGFTLQYELSYTNILNMLNLARVPIYSKDRSESEPLVIVGGPCAYNCEPIADFVDIVILGEAEEVIIEVLEIYKQQKQIGYNKKKFLEKIVSLQGVYIPSFYEVDYLSDGRINKVYPVNTHTPKSVKKRIINDLENVFYPEKLIVPFVNIVHNRVMLEIFRGCSRGCRFCQAGMIYRPVREKSVNKLCELAGELLESTGYEEISLSSLSASDYTSLQELVSKLIETHEKDRVGISLPSLRLDNLTFEIIKEIQKVRKTSLTFAPEAGSQRLRDVVNKGLTEEDLLNAVRNAFELGWSTVKLYFMIGLPTEDMKDIEEIKNLGFKVVEEYNKVDKEKRSKGLRVTVSASTFIPKPFTPFQWEAQDDMSKTIEKQQFMKEIINHRNITFNYHDVKASFLEGVFARGDRRLSKVIEVAVRNGCKFDGWRDHFDFEKWMDAFNECEIDPLFYARQRCYDEKLPWDHIDVGITKKFLISENEKSKKEEITPDCRELCSACGINVDYKGGDC